MLYIHWRNLKSGEQGKFLKLYPKEEAAKNVAYLNWLWSGLFVHWISNT